MPSGDLDVWVAQATAGRSVAIILKHNLLPCADLRPAELWPSLEALGPEINGKTILCNHVRISNRGWPQPPPETPGPEIYSKSDYVTMRRSSAKGLPSYRQRTWAGDLWPE